MTDLTPPPTRPLDHALVYCKDCEDNRCGVIENGYKARCKICDGYNTGPVDMRRAWVVVEARHKASKNGKAV